MKEEIRYCRLCHRLLPKQPLIHYHNMPKSAQYFPDQSTVATEIGVDISIQECRYCGLLQAQGEPVPYYRDVIRATGISEEMRIFRIQQFGQWIEENQLVGRKVIEIGCGKGEYMSFMEEAGLQVTGLEHLEESVAKANSNGHHVIHGFVEGEKYVIQDAPYDAFYIMNFLEHIPDPNEFLVGIANNLSDDAVGIIEVPNVDMILEHGLYSEFIQDHLSYFTSATLRKLLELNGFEILCCDEIWYRYIISAKVRKRKPVSIREFTNQLQQRKAEIDNYLSSMEAEGKTVAGWGAGHQALANLSLLEMQDRIRYIIDSAPFKQNRFTPVTHIPVVAPTILAEGEINAVIIMAAGYSDEIRKMIHDQYPEISISILREDGLTIIK